MSDEVMPDLQDWEVLCHTTAGARFAFQMQRISRENLMQLLREYKTPLNSDDARECDLAHIIPGDHFIADLKDVCFIYVRKKGEF